MLASIVLLLEPVERPKTRARIIGEHVRRTFYDLIAESNSKLAGEIHDATGVKPFSVCLLKPGGLSGEKKLPVKPPICQIRFTTLTAEVYQALIPQLMIAPNKTKAIQLGDTFFHIKRVIFTGQAEPYAGLSSYEALWQVPPQRDFSFRFVSPTSFQTGQGHLPFPLPESVYKSLWKKWNRFAPPSTQMDEDIIQVVVDHVFPRRHSIRTVLVPQKKSKFIGFVGECSFEVLGQVSDEFCRQLAVLSGFAFYAGIGAKTTVGMGQILIK